VVEGADDPSELTPDEVEERRRQLDEGYVEGLGAISSDADRAILDDLRERGWPPEALQFFEATAEARAALEMNKELLGREPANFIEGALMQQAAMQERMGESAVAPDNLLAAPGLVDAIAAREGWQDAQHGRWKELSDRLVDEFSVEVLQPVWTAGATPDAPPAVGEVQAIAAYRLGVLAAAERPHAGAAFASLGALERLVERLADA
jgi:hypothetical protein